MPISVDPLTWNPVDVTELELAADTVVRSMHSTLVIAGPGAGKTELLAQRACFLLQTGLCESPRRILAISFKRDAARNLRERVHRRLGSELASRFDSYTFDSFSKGLVDRFILALPSRFRPSTDYRVLDGKRFNEDQVRNEMLAMPSSVCPLKDYERRVLNAKRLYKVGFLRPLPLMEWPTPRHNEDTAGAALWPHYLNGGIKSAQGFPMLALLAELMLRANPLILAALRSAYQFVFLDEFQDTSAVHYILTRTAFRNSGSILTAVGDNKQRIMLWAGAVKNVFAVFQNDFSSIPVYLKRNHRSGKKLVNIQAVIAKAIDPCSVPAETAGAGAALEGECRALAFSDQDAEAGYVAAMVAGWIASGLPSREICILTRMLPGEYTGSLQAALEAAGVRSRVENELQDLLSEPITEALLDLLKIACQDRDAEAWSRTTALLQELSGEWDDRGIRTVIDLLLASLEQLGNQMAQIGADEGGITSLLKAAMEILGEDRFKALYPQYLQGDWYKLQIEAITKLLVAARQGRSWTDALDEADGINCVPIMTTHKSKGLEYNSVVFIGLEDGAHWKFKENPSEEQCGFFVTLSRAKERVVFTFSSVRTRRETPRVQGQTEIATLYELLKEAGVEVENIL
jgi:ATP-dependent DNA helicase UvrD/PcrA